jgi:plastocyanin
MSESPVRSAVQRPLRYLCRYLCTAAMCLTAVTATACGGSNNSTATVQSPSTATATATAAPTKAAPSAGSSAPASAAQIVIDGFRFGDQVTVAPGAQVTVVNKDSAEHTVTSDNAGTFDTEVKGNGRATFSAPTTPGSYPFHCTYHPSMHGVLVVQ